jgi:hypothetical protein
LNLSPIVGCVVVGYFVITGKNAVSVILVVVTLVVGNDNARLFLFKNFCSFFRRFDFLLA